MKKIVPFKKELFFNDNIAEITSISLEHSLHQGLDNQITGEFYLNGEYKITDTTTTVDKFDFNVPVDIAVDDKYDIKDVNIDIDDFYYEIFDSNVLLINIEVCLDNLKEIERCIETEEVDEIITNHKETFENLFENHKEHIEDIFEEHIEEIFEKPEEKVQPKKQTEEFATYKIYMVKENDTLEKIQKLYTISKDDLEKYNELLEIKLGDKIIIPSND
ncbi:MAG: LysM domain-containing protein [Bacilli bacterium]